MPIMGGTGGAGASDVKAGGAYYEVVGKDGVSTVLGKIETRVKGFRGFMQRVGTGLFAGGAGVLSAGTAGATTAAVKLWEDQAGGIRSFNRELEKSAELSGELAKSMSRVQGVRQDWVDAFTDPGQKMDQLRENIALIQNELKGTGSAANSARNELDDLSRIASMGNITDKILGSHEGYVNEAQARLDEAKGKTANFRDELARARRELFLLMNPAENPKLIADINAAGKALDESFRNRNLTPGQSTIAGLSRRGALDSQLGTMKSQNFLSEEIKTAEDFQKEVSKFRDSLRLDRKYIDLTSQERGAMDLVEKASQLGIGFNLQSSGILGLLPRLEQAAAEVRSGFGAASSQRFGFGDTAQKRMETLTEKIAENTNPKNLGAELVRAVQMR